MRVYQAPLMEWMTDFLNSWNLWSLQLSISVKTLLFFFLPRLYISIINIQSGWEHPTAGIHCISINIIAQCCNRMSILSYLQNKILPQSSQKLKMGSTECVALAICPMLSGQWGKWCCHYLFPGSFLDGNCSLCLHVYCMCIGIYINIKQRPMPKPSSRSLEEKCHWQTAWGIRLPRLCVCSLRNDFLIFHLTPLMCFSSNSPQQEQLLLSSLFSSYLAILKRGR